jgi:hypothetical protein
LSSFSNNGRALFSEEVDPTTVEEVGFVVGFAVEFEVKEDDFRSAVALPAAGS